MTKTKTSLEASDDLAASVQKTPNRVTLESMKARVASTEFIIPNNCRHMTIAVVTLDNGFTLVGKSAPADPKNFNEAVGKQFAFEDALSSMWPLEGYLLAEKLFLRELAK